MNNAYILNCRLLKIWQMYYKNIRTTFSPQENIKKINKLLNYNNTATIKIQLSVSAIY